jgi:hypothetical protein
MMTARAARIAAAVHAPRPAVHRLPLLLLALLPAGCVTATMWDALDHSRGERIAAVALTPVTVAIDAALIAGEVYANSGGSGCGCHARRH